MLKGLLGEGIIAWGLFQVDGSGSLSLLEGVCEVGLVANEEACGREIMAPCGEVFVCDDCVYMI